MDISNITFRNNVIYNVGQRGIVFSTPDNINSINISNNSFRNVQDNQIYMNPNGTVTNTYIINNIMQGGGSGTAIYMRNYNSGGVDWNDVYNFGIDMDTTGSVSYGGANINVDPEFVSATDLKLSPGSPCIDAGAGSGTHSEVPSTDYRDQARPVDVELYDNIDNGTDMGAYEMLLTESTRTFFVNADGSNTAPYDTKVKGATTVKGLLDNITQQNGDIVEVSEDGGTIDDSGSTITSITKNLLIRSYSGNTNKPSVKVLNNNDGFVINGGSAKIRQLKIFKDGPDAINGFITFYGTLVSPKVSECEIWAVDPINNSHSYGVCIGAGQSISISNELKIEKNLIYNVGYPIWGNEGGAP